MARLRMDVPEYCRDNDPLLTYATPALRQRGAHHNQGGHHNKVRSTIIQVDQILTWLTLLESSHYF